MEKLPSAFVTVPEVVPLITTLAPIRDVPSSLSVTFPVMVRCWAITLITESTISKNVNNAFIGFNLLIIIIFKLGLFIDKN